ncbi:hypothetical protein C6P40_000405 [Pichia californica]|uniref:D-xylose 1-dehydrogenase (NADP(+), D-xylono-1,5-lactone-forming) n=1 Tax=Pichia californica TaxID=460514 RepID=A0A9P6WKU9_9ASCO|nr:hypothetical protein C6P42_002247 [[Candida] californica]KAG0688872.1 hypothetical protein C6P40_000405 [[Candida] californica]
MSENESKFVLKWGVIGLGQFAAKYINDVFKNYIHDENYGSQIKHELKSIISTTSIENCENFIKLLDTNFTGIPEKFDSYNEFLKSDIDIVYIATPNSEHYFNAIKALNSNKNIIVEKTFTINSKQAKNIQKLAKEKGLFVLDGIWTRYLPTFEKIESIINEGIIGKIYRINADLSHNCKFENNRLYNKNLGGGVLFDNLIYSIIWSETLLKSKNLPLINSWIIKQNDVDVNTGISLNYDNDAIGIATGSFQIESPLYSVLIEGEKGYIRINKTSKPTKAIIYFDKIEKEIQLPEIKGIGYYYEANIAAISIKDGLLEPKLRSLDYTVRILEIFDKVKIQNNIKFPNEIERLD